MPLPLPFTWQLLTFPEEHQPPELQAEAYISRTLETPPVTVSVNRQGILVTNGMRNHMLQLLNFEGGFPGYDKALSDSGNAQRTIVGQDGSVLFVAATAGKVFLCRWPFGSDMIQFVALLTRVPESVAITSDGRRLAVVQYGTQGWQAQAWALPEGRFLGEYTWDSIYSGSLSEFSFSDNGTSLCLTIDVFAQSGSDFTDGTCWEIIGA